MIPHRGGKAVSTQIEPYLASGEAGYFVPRTHDHCTRCGDQNFDGTTRVCLTCTYPDHPCSRVYWESRERAACP